MGKALDLRFSGPGFGTPSPKVLFFNFKRNSFLFCSFEGKLWSCN